MPCITVRVSITWPSRACIFGVRRSFLAMSLLDYTRRAGWPRRDCMCRTWQFSIIHCKSQNNQLFLEDWKSSLSSFPANSVFLMKIRIFQKKTLFLEKLTVPSPVQTIMIGFSWFRVTSKNASWSPKPWICNGCDYHPQKPHTIREEGAPNLSCPAHTAPSGQLLYGG